MKYLEFEKYFLLEFSYCYLIYKIIYVNFLLKNRSTLEVFVKKGSNVKNYII